MVNIQDKGNCSGCHACAVACPKQCIAMCVDSEGFLYPKVDQSSCVHCGKCVLICPKSSTKKPQINENLRAYAMINQQDEIRERSSSGGVFYALAEKHGKPKTVGKVIESACGKSGSGEIATQNAP